MKALQDVLMVFHESADCPGIITSNEAGCLVCAECGQTVGVVDPRVLKGIVELVDGIQQSPNEAAERGQNGQRCMRPSIRAGSGERGTLPLAPPRLACPHCGSRRTFRARDVRICDYLLFPLFSWPWRCEACLRKFHVWRLRF
jgi:hypothetical protein